MQQYAEVLVRANKTAKSKRTQKLIWGVGIFALLVVIALSAYAMGQFPKGMGWTVIPFTLLLILLVLWGVLCALEGQQFEYEYAVSDQSLTIDRIRAQKNRKQLLHLPLSSVSAFGELKGEHSSDRLLIDATGTPVRSGTWYLDYHDEKGNQRLLITPSQQALEILKRALRRVMPREDW